MGLPHWHPCFKSHPLPWVKVAKKQRTVCLLVFTMQVPGRLLTPLPPPVSSLDLQGLWSDQL